MTLPLADRINEAWAAFYSDSPAPSDPKEEQNNDD